MAKEVIVDLLNRLYDDQEARIAALSKALEDTSGIGYFLVQEAMSISFALGTFPGAAGPFRAPRGEAP